MPSPSSSTVPSAGSRRLEWAAVAGATLLVVAMKPWALSHPQLWAEDGSVHLLDNEAHGLGALLLPYRGYLHTLPRLLAWLAGATTDVAQWPLFYTLAALGVAVALFARMTSPRLVLPGKPWLILGFVLVANAGETFLNLTNLHWLTAFFLVQQTLIAPARTPGQWLRDLGILVVIGLTGPFVIVFLPLFVLRWVRERDRYSGVVLAVAAALALLQASLVATTGPRFEPQEHALNPGSLIHVLGIRLIAWPLLGPKLALLLPAPVPALLLAVGLAGVGWWVMRPDPARAQRLTLALAFVLIAGACIYRLRPDTWTFVELENGDSYFYVPRLLLAWLVIMAGVTATGVTAWVLRGAGLLAVLLNLGGFVKETPPDYHWLEQCGAIRRGEPADLAILPQGWILHYPGRMVYGTVGPGWYDEESNGRRTWRWAAGPATLRLVVRESHPVTVRVRLTLHARQSETVTVRLAGKTVGTLPLDEQPRTFELDLGQHPMGFHDLELTSDRPPVIEATATARSLGFALDRWWVK
ncbi:MAG TPA: hypothetical protein PLU52_03420 [Opitutaceae bacterium]|nr:hypothetical protein [Opitutaceae bacterium]HND61025.1 hypothetical protein [Opitutaceae bacterium]